MLLTGINEVLPDVPLTSALFRAGLPVKTGSACCH